jgi:hypothetical protein
MVFMAGGCGGEVSVLEDEICGRVMVWYMVLGSNVESAGKEGEKEAKEHL